MMKITVECTTSCEKEKTLGKITKTIKVDEPEEFILCVHEKHLHAYHTPEGFARHSKSVMDIFDFKFNTVQHLDDGIRPRVH